MVRAILDGRKTQTRRVLKPQFPPQVDRVGFTCFHPRGWCAGRASSEPGAEWHRKLRYAIGDRLWVRETWGINHDDYMAAIPKARPADVRDDQMIYFATEDDAEICNDMPRRPSIHMPRWASRLTLTVTDIRIQRVQDISAADAIEEGLAICAKDSVPTWKYGLPDRDGLPGADDDGWQWQDWCVDPRNAFGKLWNSINAARRYGWNDNPWVVALTFTAEQRNIDAVAEKERAHA